MDAAKFLLLMEDQRRAESYSEKVKRLFGDYYVAHWPMSEASGDVADNLEGTAARDGAYTGVTLGETGIGDGLTCPLFDGVNDFVDIYSASLNTAWAQGDSALMIWAKMFNVDVWTDDTIRFFYTLYCDADNRCTLERDGGTDNRIYAYTRGGGEEDYTLAVGLTDIDWMCFIVTINEGNTIIRLYKDGSQTDTDTHAGPWSGNLDSSNCVIGAKDKVPNNPFNGWLAHMVIGCGSGCAAAIDAVAAELATV